MVTPSSDLGASTEGLRAKPQPPTNSAYPRTGLSSFNLRDPESLTLGFLLVAILGICERGYRLYRFDELLVPGLYETIAQGRANAPEQYRIGVVIPVYWLSTHLHLRMSLFFPVIDAFCAVLGVYLLFRIMQRSVGYARTTVARRWIASAVFVILTLYYMQWVYNYQRPTTLPTCAIVACILWLLSPFHKNELTTSTEHTTQWGIAAALLLLTLVQSLMRPDLMVLLFLGVFVGCLTGLTKNLSLSRSLAMTTSVLAMLIAMGTQLFLSTVAYPNATYGGSPLFMLAKNVVEPQSWLTFLCFLIPFLWILSETLRTRFREDGLSLAVLIGAIGYIPLWMTVGRTEEVRIFIPLGMALIPLMVQLVLRRVEEPS